MKGPVTINDIVNAAFPADEERHFRRSPTVLLYFKQWRLAHKRVIAQLNRNIKVGKTKSLQTVQNLTNNNIAADVFTVAGLKRKIAQLLTNLNLKVFPAISNDSFWASPAEVRSFKFVHIVANATTAVMVVGAAGHPVLLKSNAVLELEAKIKVSYSVQRVMKLTNSMGRLLST